MMKRMTMALMLVVAVVLTMVTASATDSLVARSMKVTFAATPNPVLRRRCLVREVAAVEHRYRRFFRPHAIEIAPMMSSERSVRKSG